MTDQLLVEAVRRHRGGDLAGAEPLYRRQLQARPRDVQALTMFGVLMAQKGNSAEALRLLHRATGLAPDDVLAWRMRAQVLAGMDRHGEALVCLEKLVGLLPQDGDAWINRGSALAALGRHAEALACFDQALVLAPSSVTALGNRGMALLELCQPEAALDAFERALAGDPKDANAQNGLGLALQALHRHEDALERFDRALMLRPAYADALNNRGVSLQALGRTEAALGSYDQAIALHPGDAWFHWNAGLCRLLVGDYERGWPDYEWRLRTGAIAVPEFGRPLWQGERIGGRTLLLHTEQGLGDIIQFCRYAPLIQDAGRVILQAPAVLVDLLRTLPAPVEVVSAGTRPPRFDLHCPLLSLPARFRSTLADLPRTVPYLTAPFDAVAHWLSRLGPDGRKIGICWQGNPAVRIDAERSVPLARFAPLAGVPGVRLISLQKGHGLEQLSDLPGVETVGPDGPATFVDTAAIMQCLDLVITSDTAVAHLAGALARPVWLATSFVPDWRWGLGTESCAWYPTMRLFRQPRRGDWNAVFAALAAALA
jgi:tetratricopeptide (TPR) repeat protein